MAASSTTNPTLYADEKLPVTSSSSSGYNEPSAMVDGSNQFVTGNSYAALSHNSGATWSFLNPHTIFGNPLGGYFCCDQVVLDSPTAGVIFWLLQYDQPSSLVLASSAPSDLTNWCRYSITPATFGQPSTTTIDFSHLEVSSDYLYIISDLDASGHWFAGVIRITLSSLSSCGTISPSHFTNTSTYNLEATAGAGATMYFGANCCQTLGSSFRIYSWPESSSAVVYQDYTIDLFSYMQPNSGQYCGSQDGVVKNWCQYNDSEVTGGYVLSGTIGFAFNAKQDSSHPFPYVRRIYFNVSNMAYKGFASFYSNYYAIQFLMLSPNGNGGIGGAFAWGGGTGSTHDYPGAGVFIDDSMTPTQPWSALYYLWGQGNACVDSYSHYYRWGDYLTVRPTYPLGSQWVATGYGFVNGSCGYGQAQPHVLIFGR